MWGWRDLPLGLVTPRPQALYADAVDTLARNIHRWDMGWWTRYAIVRPAPDQRTNLAYHQLHVHQLAALKRTSPRDRSSATP